MSDSHPMTLHIEVLNEAVHEYQEETGINLSTHSLTAQILSCQTPQETLNALHEQLKSLSQYQQKRHQLHLIVDTFDKFVAPLGECVGIVFPPANIISAIIGIILLAVQDHEANQGLVIEILERISVFIRRLEAYTVAAVSLTTQMKAVLIRVMTAVITALGTVTRQFDGTMWYESRRKFLLSKITTLTSLSASGHRHEETKKALEKLDRLAAEECQMAGTQSLILNYVVDARVSDLNSKVTKDIAERRSKAIHEWLSAPDPSTNHHGACKTYRKGQTNWFIQGDMFQEWKSAAASFLWIHGKPGSGKTVLCSSIIEHLGAMCEGGAASLAFFYLDFWDTAKHCKRDLVASLITQLSASDDSDPLGPHSGIVSNHFLPGQKKLCDDALATCLKAMLEHANQLERPTYLIIDGLDESPNGSGFPSPREEVLRLLKDLADLSLANVHVCVTSRLDVDIERVVSPLAPYTISLHDQSGQKDAIDDYIRTVIYSPDMEWWRKDEKEDVFKNLSDRTDGSFRWASSQLEVLRHSFSPCIDHILDELPESLDKTYVRALKDIKKPNRTHARCILQCLAVAARPLRVEELAEVIAVHLDDPEGIPKLRPEWRRENQEEALLALVCSGLISTVQTSGPGSTVVNFSHVSVKIFLTSGRLLGNSMGADSFYHIDIGHAHTILAQGSLAALLHLDDPAEENTTTQSSPLAEYAAEYWVIHAQASGVSLCLHKAIKYLLDSDKPYFAAWLKIHNPKPDVLGPLRTGTTMNNDKPGTQELASSPKYYADLLGFPDLVDLVSEDPWPVESGKEKCRRGKGRSTM